YISYNPKTGAPLFDTIVPSMISRLPQIIVAVVIVLVLAASMSTLSSLVLTSSSTLTLDVIYHGRAVDEKKKITAMRLFIIFFIVVSAVIAILKDTFNFSFIAQMMGVSWGALAGAFLAPFLYGLYWKKTTKASVVVSFIVGVGLMLLQMYISLSGNNFSGPVLGYIFASSVRSGAVTMVLGLIIVPIVSLFTPKMNPHRVDNMFKGYDKPVEVKIKQRLGK
ncbi:MAG: sodium:solute symporter, partial [Oscillospiraceae bacterium]|nr:sodium:solute symporter [Oscillospiraceae bacterium]